MIELYVFNLEFNNLGEISEYKEIKIERQYTKVSTLILRVASSKEMLNLLKHRNILSTKDNPDYGYMIENFFYTDAEETEIEIQAFSLNWMLSWRTIERQQRYSGNFEDVVKSFVTSNCINPTNPNRAIPNLFLDANTGIKITTESSRTGTSVGDHCFELCNTNEASIDVLMDHDTKKFKVVTWQGVDRSTLQSNNGHVIFSKEYDNIINQTYINNHTDYKSTAVVAGEGEGVERKVLLVNDEVNGFDRRELFVDARDLQSTYYDDNNNEKTLTPIEYNETLKKRGDEKLSEYGINETFESEVDMYSQFVYGADYGLGDKVSVKNDEINRVLHTRVISAIITVDKKGKHLKINFGATIPDLVEKLKKKVF